MNDLERQEDADTLAEYVNGLLGRRLPNPVCGNRIIAESGRTELGLPLQIGGEQEEEIKPSAKRTVAARA